MLTTDCALTQLPRDKTKLLREIDELEQQRLASLDERNYDFAATLRRKQGKAAEQAEAERLAIEHQRQELERSRFDRAAQQLLQLHEEKWSGLLEEAEQRWEQRQHQLEEQHLQKRLELEEQLKAYAASQKCTHSSYVRDMALAERKLATSHAYDECKMVRRKIQDLEREEVEKFHATLERTLDRRRQQLAEVQERERQQLLIQLKNERVALLRRKQEEQAQARQQFANLQQDMRVAHTTEFRLASQAAVSQPLREELRRKKQAELRERQGNPHGTLLSKAATYRGTQLLKRAQAANPMPSLCDLYDPADPSTPNYVPPF